MPNHNLGGLSLIDDDMKSDDSIVYNVYQQQAQDPNLQTGTLQSLYGTAAMPVFEWVKTIQSGERIYNPQSDFDNSMLEEYQKLQDQEED